MLISQVGFTIVDNLDPSSSTTPTSVGNGVMPTEGVGKGVPGSTLLPRIVVRAPAESFEGCSNTVLDLLKSASTPLAAEAKAKVKATGSFIVESAMKGIQR